MPDPDEDDEEGIEPNGAGDKGIVIPTVKAEELPAISPPQTKTPITFNQQVNFQQIPASAWDGLTPVQRMDLSTKILAQMDTMDQRHFDFAIRHVQTETTRGMVRAICGTLITVVGFCFAGYLALHGQTIIALSISLPLATILAIVVGNRFVSRS